MNCPVCKTTELKIADRQGVEIDYCPSCRGVWLDRGELDKIIDRMTGPRPESAPQPQPHQHTQQPHPQSPMAMPPHAAQHPYPHPHPKSMYDSDMYDSDHRGYRHGYDNYGRPYKRKRWFKDLFDVFE